MNVNNIFIQGYFIRTCVFFCFIKYIDITNTLNDIKIVLWNDYHNILSQDVVGK